MVLGNQNGKFAWRSKRFSRSARNVSINGTVLTAELCEENGSWQVDTFDLDDQIVVVGGELVVTEIPSVRVLAAAEVNDFLPPGLYGRSAVLIGV